MLSPRRFSLNRRGVWSALCFAPLLVSCGIDGLFLTPRGFDPTPPPRVTLRGTAAPESRVDVYARSGRRIATAQADAEGRYQVALPPAEEGVNLLLFAARGPHTLKRVVPEARRGEVSEVPALDAASTAHAQLATYEVLEEAGSSFAATPAPGLRALLQSMTATATPALAEYAAVVDELLAAAAFENDHAGAFEPASARLAPEFLTGAGLAPELADRYRSALVRAAADFGLQIRCNPNRLNVLFTVDGSGRARDGNGAPQLMRQATKEGRIYLGFTSDESSPIADEAIPRTLVPNNPSYAMTDDGQNGDEEAGDGVYSVVVPLPRGARLLYKYTNGSAGEGFTGTEEWPGNARLLQVEDVLTGRPDGEPDCLVVRRDSFGDEASNKNFVNLNAIAKQRGGTVDFVGDLGGAEAPRGRGTVRLGGLGRLALRSGPPLTPAGVPEARENGVCAPCPPPLVLDPDDRIPPALLEAERLSTTRVRVRFSEPIRPEDGRDVSRYLYLDESDRSVPIVAARVAGSEVTLELIGVDPNTPARLWVRRINDLAVVPNLLKEAKLVVRPDVTPPRLLSARARSILELDPNAVVRDPTVGEVVELVFDERPEASALGDPSRYRIAGLPVLSARAEGESTVYLETAPQKKGTRYTIELAGLRDEAGNQITQEGAFEAFALYRVRFGVVPGFAFADRSGEQRGLPRGEKLYLTGTPLAAARALDGRSLAIAGRTDVTGVPAFELVPQGETHRGQPVYSIELLLPPGSWAWKSAHGVEGEFSQAPTTLEKVYKVLATANDATGVRVDPETLRAENGLDYGGSALSETGEDPARRGMMFKREAPDEVCEVLTGDVDCPKIVVGAWRAFVRDSGGKTIDYDDGLITLPPHRPDVPDYAPPKLLDARARDSESVLLSFDEAIEAPTARLKVELARAEDGQIVPVQVLDTRELPPHQAVFRIQGEPLESGSAYTVRYRGASDRFGHADRTWRSQTVLAPERQVPFRPLVDQDPPLVTAVRATDLTEVVVTFNEAIDPATVESSFLLTGQSGPLAVSASVLLPDRRQVALTTAKQSILTPYRLEVRGVGDVADPPNVLTSTVVDWIGFGEREPPEVARIRALGSSTVLVRFDEAMEAASVLDTSHYAIEGARVLGVQFAGDPERQELAFNTRLAPKQRSAVLLSTSPLSAGQKYTLTLKDVADLSGNLAALAVDFEAVGEPPAVDVVLEVEVSDTVKVAGEVPSRAIGLGVLADTREGVYVLGARTDASGVPISGATGPVNDTLRGFPPEGQPLDGPEPRLRDDGVPPDLAAGDGVFTILIPRVPLGTTLIWKSFAPYATAYRDRSPNDSAAAFADALPGPSVFADGQEFPGNENGAVILDQGAAPNLVRIRSLYGDEISFKKNTGRPAYRWVVEDTR